MASAEDIEIQTASLRIAARAWGPRDGRPVLAMHGWLDNAATFDALIPKLLALNPKLRVVAWDAAGHGRSEHRAGAYHFIDYVADAIATIDELGWSTCTLLGHSMGAGIATLVAGALGDRIEAGVFIEGIGPLSQKAAEAPKRLARAVLEERKRRARPARVYTQFDAAVEKRAELGAMQLSSARKLIERGTVQLDDGFAWASDPALRSTSRQYFAEDTILGYFAQITCPSLFIRAASGWPFDPALVARRRDTIANLQYVEIEGHHHLHLDNPAPVAAAIHQFLGPSPTASEA